MEKKIAICENSGMESYRKATSHPREIAARLVKTREALGYDKKTPERSQAEFARKAGLRPTAYNNYEKNKRIGLDAAISLCCRYNLTLDWIYFGETPGLPEELVGKLFAPAKERSSTQTGRRRPFRPASSRSLTG